MEEVKMEDDGNYDRREYTEDEVDSILNSLPSGMLSKIIAKRLESNVSY